MSATSVSLPSDPDELRAALHWPSKYDLFGIQVSATDYDHATRAIIGAARDRDAAVVTCHSTHALMESTRCNQLGMMINSFSMVTPDGQPVRWALNRLHRLRLTERVYGPQLMTRVCEAASEEGIAIYLVGGSPQTVEKLAKNLRSQFSNLQIVGFESPPYRELTPEEKEAMCRRIRESDAAIVFVGLGSPKQDRFAYEHRGHFPAVQICVGAAFDFLAGTKRSAPAWMQSRGLEWMFRLSQEPRRLWRRYLVTNLMFVAKFSKALARRR